MSTSQMKPSRRSVFQFAGGAAAGALLTPAPWRLITDTALWSESWPGVPLPLRGEIRAKFTNCALCTAGCAVRARCVGEQPVSLAGVAGGLCPFGLAAHHLPYHPARLKQGRIAEAAAEIAKRGTQGLALLDLNPGRTASWTYRRTMQAINGAYLAAPEPFAVDLHAAKTVLSFGVPVLDGWGNPANVFAARDGFHLIQVEPIESGTAVLADEWIPVIPGNESVIAQTILRCLQQGNLSALARQLVDNGPSVVLGDLPEIPEINRLLGAYGKTIVARPEAPVPDPWKKSAAPLTRLADLPDNSIRVLLIDEASAVDYIPWHRIARKLVRENPLVVTFTASRGGYARYANYALPVAVYPETLDDIAPAIDRVSASFKLSVPLVTPPAGMANLAEFAGALAGVQASNSLRERAGEIHRIGQGTLLTYADGKVIPLKDLTEDAFWKALNEGAEWVGQSSEPIAPPLQPVPVAAAESSSDLPLVAIAQPHTPPGSPLMTKLYQESNLRLAPNRIVLSPADAATARVRNNGRAILQTRLGKCAVEVTIDPAVPQGSVRVGGSPGIQDVCGPAARAKVVSA
uniref:Anaerobic dehydrogenases typically selenocysteine-containing-like protein n=1 Tax=Solibacter usitatus (strain Ellin6076) TaxID=234267 RepID=Q02C03_SOLUE